MGVSKHTKEQQGKIFEALLEQNDSLVYFDTLPPNVQNAGMKNIKNSMNKLKISQSVQEDGSIEFENRLQFAMNFLRDAIQFERSKEIAFFNFYKDNLPKELQINIKNIDNFDYNQFIIQINSILKTEEQFKKALTAEIKRIEARNEAKVITSIDSKGKKYSYIEGHERKEYMLQYDSGAFFRGIISNEGNASKVINSILEHGGSELLQLNADLKLDGRQLAALIVLITQFFYNRMATTFQNEDIFEISQMLRQNMDSIKDDIKNNIKAEIIQPLKENTNLIDTLNSVADQFGITKEAMAELKRQKWISETQVRNATAKFTKALDSSTKQNSQKLEKELEKIDIRGLVQATHCVKVQTFYTGEDLAIMDWAISKISPILGGGKNPTDDFQAGYATTTININDTAFNRALQKKLIDIQSRVYREEIGAMGSSQSFSEYTNALKKSRDMQKKVIEDELKKANQSSNNLAEMVRHFNIHGTVKGYFGAGGTRNRFAMEGGFGGASFGATLLDEIQNVNKLVTAAGGEPFSDEQIQSLVFLAMNAGSHLIGKANKEPLERYFSIFAGLFMFNDAALIAEDVKNMKEHLQTSTVMDLHMYTLNGVILPSSFILENTYNALFKVATEVSQKVLVETGIRTTLHTYNKSYESAANITVSSMAETVLNATKFEITFLKGFLDILKQLEEAVNGTRH